MELSTPVVHITSNTISLPLLQNKCYIIFISHKDSLGQVEKVANYIGQKPRLVILIDINDQTSLAMLGVHHEPWVRFVPGSSYISMTCSGDGVLRRGLLHDLAGSLGLIKEACSMKNKEIRISYNKGPPYFDINNGIIEHTLLEAPILTTFLEKYSLRPTFSFAQQKWGSQDKSTGIWNGVVGLVGNMLLLLIPDFIDRLAMSHPTLE